DALQLLQAQWRAPTKAMAYVYADVGPLTVPQTDWPAWVCDRPAPGLTVPQYSPVLTVTAEADTPTEAVALCQKRQSQLTRDLRKHAAHP
ncbi:MAG: hypothetical protein AAGG72_01905, partial [Pseudomonadota bacterium]